MTRTIGKISEVHGALPGMVDVSTWEEDERGNRDGFEEHRIALTWDVDTNDADAIRSYVERELDGVSE